MVYFIAGVAAKRHFLGGITSTLSKNRSRIFFIAFFFCVLSVACCVAFEERLQPLFFWACQRRYRPPLGLETPPPYFKEQPKKKIVHTVQQKSIFPSKITPYLIRTAMVRSISYTINSVRPAVQFFSLQFQKKKEGISRLRCYSLIVYGQLGGRFLRAHTAQPKVTGLGCGSSAPQSFCTLGVLSDLSISS